MPEFHLIIRRSLGFLRVQSLPQSVKVRVSRGRYECGSRAGEALAGKRTESANNNPASAPARASGDGLGFAKQNAPTKSGSHQSDHRAAVTCAACEPRSGEVELGRKPSTLWNIEGAGD